MLTVIELLQESGAKLYIDVGLTVILLLVIVFISIKLNASRRFLICVVAATIGIILSYAVFDLKILTVALFVSCLYAVMFITLLLSEKEKAKLIRHHQRLDKKNVLTGNESVELIETLNKTVQALSETQTGALITIERDDDLSDIIAKSGTEIDAPVSPEILETIFYKGTPLHDGATIIKGSTIIASAVFYQPTQRALTGKFGSRHRAAMGISEICDAITIVVSEETGKVSIAYKGELIHIPVSQFSKKLSELMFAKD